MGRRWWPGAAPGIPRRAALAAALAVALTAALLGVLGGALAVLAAWPGAVPAGDGPFFAAAVDRAPSVLAVYADPRVQSGPVQLGLFWLLARLPAHLGRAGAVLGLLAVGAAAAVPLERALRRVAADLGAPRPWLPALGAVGILAAGGVLADAYRSGHPAQLWVPLAWLLAARWAGDGRPVRAGLLLGAATGLETWALLGLPVLLLGAERARWRPPLAGLAAAGGAALALWLPFVLHGPFRMLDMSWLVGGGSLPALLWPGGTVDWPLRGAQTAAVLAAGAAVARVAPRHRAGPLVVLAVVTTRLLLDPQMLDYYLLPLRVLLVGLAVLALAAPRLGWVLRGGLAAAAYLALLTPLGLPGPVGLPLTAALLAALVPSLRSDHARPDPVRRA